MSYKYKYNGKEYQDELGLNLYDLGARMYDSAIGRFMVMDPLADFVNYQSPYVFGDDNPIINIDFYGMAKCGWLCRTINKIIYGKNTVTRGQSDKKISNATGWKLDKNKKKSNPPPCSDCPGRKQTESIVAEPLDIITQKITFSDIEIYPIAQNIKKKEEPKEYEFRNIKIRPGTIVELNITYEPSRFLIESSDSNEKIINDLVKTLKEYSEIKIIIYGNMSGVPVDNNAQVNTLEGRMKVGKFKSERANAILKVLQANGIPASRIQSQPGNSNSMSVDIKFIK